MTSTPTTVLRAYKPGVDPKGTERWFRVCQILVELVVMVIGFRYRT